MKWEFREAVRICGYLSSNFGASPISDNRYDQCCILSELRWHCSIIQAKQRGRAKAGQTVNYCEKLTEKGKLAPSFVGILLYLGTSYAIIWLHRVLGSLLLPQGRKNFVPHPFLEECASICITLSSAGCCSSAKEATSHQPLSLFLQFSGTSSRNAFPVLCLSFPKYAHAGLSDGKTLAGWGY